MGRPRIALALGLTLLACHRHLAQASILCRGTPIRAERISPEASAAESWMTYNVIYSEEVNRTLGVRKIRASGCPNYNIATLSSGNGGQPVHQDHHFTVPLYPQLAPQNVSRILQQTRRSQVVGIAYNSIAIYSAADADRTFVSEPDAVDCFGGHTKDGMYQYQVPPTGLLDQLGEWKVQDTCAGQCETPGAPTAASHSPQIGWALDGFPIYGPNGFDGHPMQPCTPEQAEAQANQNPNELVSPAAQCLDEGSGLPGLLPFDDYQYRYYLLGPLSDRQLMPNRGYLQHAPKIALKGCRPAVPGSATDRVAVSVTELPDCELSSSGTGDPAFSPAAHRGCSQAYGKGCCRSGGYQANPGMCSEAASSSQQLMSLSRETWDLALGKEIQLVSHLCGCSYIYNKPYKCDSCCAEVSGCVSSTNSIICSCRYRWVLSKGYCRSEDRGVDWTVMLLVVVVIIVVVLTCVSFCFCCCRAYGSGKVAPAVAYLPSDNKDWATMKATPVKSSSANAALEPYQHPSSPSTAALDPYQHPSISTADPGEPRSPAELKYEVHNKTPTSNSALSKPSPPKLAATWTPGDLKGLNQPVELPPIRGTDRRASNSPFVRSASFSGPSDNQSGPPPRPTLGPPSPVKTPGASTVRISDNLFPER